MVKSSWGKVDSSSSRGKAEIILSQCDDQTKDALYRSVWFDRVCEDIRSHEKDMDLGGPLTEDQVHYAADSYVYEGEYDCDQSYWDNIEYVIKLALEFA